jgi:1-deoxy-D-xylulose-5-phosphate reductoisomerase
MQNLVILGATGSIGRQTAEVAEAAPDRLRVLGLAARRNVDGMEALVARLSPRWVVMAEREAAERLKPRVPSTVAVDAGQDALVERLGGLSRDAAVVAAMSGFQGLRPTLAAAEAGARVCVANKETLVAAGGLLRAAVTRGGARLLPVDSEHSALLQALGDPPAPFWRLWLTCSGGPFRGWSRTELERVRVDDALRHPVWRMGVKNTLDSATLMNKGLEVIEAHVLFDAPFDRIGVVVHPEGVVHSMVEFRDGSVIAQMGSPDMRLPIQVALSWPERWEGAAERLDWGRARQLTFEPPDTETFPAIDVARHAGELGGTAPAVLNAANEVAIQRFLAGHIGFLDIVRLVADVLAQHVPEPAGSLAQVEAADAWARRRAESWRR